MTTSITLHVFSSLRNPQKCLGKRRETEERKRRYSVVGRARKSLKIKGFLRGTYQNGPPISSQIAFVEVERSWNLYVEDGRSYGSPIFKAFWATQSPQKPETLVKSRQIESCRKSTVLKDFLTRWGELGETSSQTAATRFGTVKEKSSPKVGRTSGCTCRWPEREVETT